MVSDFKYRDFFDIDPEYFPQVDDKAIEKNPDLWTKFYPHETFISLISDMISVLNRKNKVSLWVDGAYGTGKSHAALTLKKLLDATDTEVEKYFYNFNDVLDSDLLQKFLSVKSGDKPILTVHRYGTSNIKNDNDLVCAIQDSILFSLKQANYDISMQESLKSAMLRWLGNEANGQYFERLILDDYKEYFSGDKINDVVNKLQTYEGKALETYMNKIMDVGHDRGIKPFSLSIDELCDWIIDIINNYKLKAIVFFWDEFTEYFQNNQTTLTGFQRIVDLSSTEPFYFVLVTHSVEVLLSENINGKKILDRFKNPLCTIELPDNMAFQLMGKALKVCPDQKKIWEKERENLYLACDDAIDYVEKNSKIGRTQLKNVLPIHPYAALALKHISSAFRSNQRSMFDFIKNVQDENIKGFQWFIDNHFVDNIDNPFLSVDMLWDFFYEKGRNNLSPDIRNILDAYKQADITMLDEDCQAVYKTVLILQAISARVGNGIDILKPTEKVLSVVFNGINIELENCLHNLETCKLLYSREVKNQGKLYQSRITQIDEEVLLNYRKEVEHKKTSRIIKDACSYFQDMGTADYITIPKKLEKRFRVHFVTYEDLKKNIEKISLDRAIKQHTLFDICVVFGKDKKETCKVYQEINKIKSDLDSHIVILDVSSVNLSEEEFRAFIDRAANATYYSNKDRGLSKRETLESHEIIDTWIKRAIKEEGTIYSSIDKAGKKIIVSEQLVDYLMKVLGKEYPGALEVEVDFSESAWKEGCQKGHILKGIKKDIPGELNNKRFSITACIGESVWEKDQYWIVYPDKYVSKIKIQIDDIVQKKIQESGRISVDEMIGFLFKAPYGCLPSCIFNFILGFLLREYAREEYVWSDGSVTKKLDEDTLALMVSNYLKSRLTGSVYKPEYIARVTREQRAFINLAVDSFGLDKKNINSIEATKKEIRNSMAALKVPLWGLMYLESLPEEITREDLVVIIKGFCGLANNKNMETGYTEDDMIKRLGALYQSKSHIGILLHRLICSDTAAEGMKYYLQSYKSGILIKLAEKISDNSMYISRVQKKLNVEGASWLWSKETADEKIDEVILEYEIILETRDYISSCNSFEDVVEVWKRIIKRCKVPAVVLREMYPDQSDLIYLFERIADRGFDISFYEQFLKALREQEKKEWLDKKFNNNSRLLLDFYTMYKSVDVKPEEIADYITDDVFSLKKEDYFKRIDEAEKEVILKSKKNELMSIWREKTGTINPNDWSKKNKMPILCMVPAEEYNQAKKVFDILNGDVAKDYKFACEFLSGKNYIKDLNDITLCDKRFDEEFLGDYIVILDREVVKEELYQKVSVNPYEWIFNPNSKKIIEELANDIYVKQGYLRAYEKVDEMGNDDLKKYLKALIKDKVQVGVAIIKEQ